MIANLGMYPFAHLSDAYDQLWGAVHARLDGSPPVLDPSVGLTESWYRPDLLLGQTCGWPLVTALPDLSVVGAFDMRVPFAVGGRYRSVIVASKPLELEHWQRDESTVVAVNNDDSLSGWVSLRWAWGGIPGHVEFTGAHLESMRHVADGRAHVASIDAVSFEHAAHCEPAMASRLHVIDHGPMVPTLPLVTMQHHMVHDLRAAITGAIADPGMAATLSRLRIRGFLPLDRSDYQSLPGLVPLPHG